MRNLSKMLIVSVLALNGCSVPRAASKPDTIDKMGYVTHEVVKGETPKYLAKKYNMSKEEVFTLNPELNKQKPRQKLIPGSTVKLLQIKK